MTDRLFSYGSLMFPRVMRRVTGSRAHGRPAILEDYGRYRIRGQIYPGIVARQGEAVEGVLYCGISPAQWRRLDAFEGKSYRRQRVYLRGPGDATLSAWTYVIAGRHRCLLGRRSWSRSRFARRHLARFLASLA